jgi:hypothetical protein
LSANSQEFQGIIDIHAHADPDTTRRSLDVLEMCKLYRDRGFRGVLLMNHWDSNGGQAWMPIHTFAWRELLNGLRENGVTEAEIDRMTQTNPTFLLGID